MSPDYHWDDSRTDKFGVTNSEGSEIIVGNQSDGQGNVIGENFEWNASHTEDKTIGHKSNGGMNHQEPNSSVNINDNANGGQQENVQKISNQWENNDGDGIHSDKDNVGTEDASKDKLIPNGSQLELLNETNAQLGAWPTQATESRNEKELQVSFSKGEVTKYNWKLCNATAETDYIPCLDNEEAIKRLPTTNHYEHRRDIALRRPQSALCGFQMGIEGQLSDLTAERRYGTTMSLIPNSWR